MDAKTLPGEPLRSSWGRSTRPPYLHIGAATCDLRNPPCCRSCARGRGSPPLPRPRLALRKLKCAALERLLRNYWYSGWDNEAAARWSVSWPNMWPLKGGCCQDFGPSCCCRPFNPQSPQRRQCLVHRYSSFALHSTPPCCHKGLKPRT